jgi:hypothetical protein
MTKKESAVANEDFTGGSRTAPTGKKKAEGRGIEFSKGPSPVRNKIATHLSHRERDSFVEVPRLGGLARDDKKESGSERRFHGRFANRPYAEKTIASRRSLDSAASLGMTTKRSGRQRNLIF